MTDLTNVLGGPWSPPKQKQVDPPSIQLRNAMLDAGIVEPPEQIHFDGKLHRFNSKTSGKSGHSKPGFYVAFDGPVPAGFFGCWRLGLESPWRADIGRDLTTAEQMSNSKRMAEAKALRDAEREKTKEVASNTVSEIWNNAAAASPEHPYLQKKGVDPHGARITGDGRLIVPVYDKDGNLTSLQYISGDGDKRYHPGGAIGGNFWVVGTTDDPGTVYLAEGFATAATIHQVTERPCFVAYSANNLPAVAGHIRENHSDLVIVADNDESGVGESYANQAAAKYGASVVMPLETGDANDYFNNGNDLLELLKPKSDDYLIPANDFCQKPAPIKWVVKNWIQDNALVMVHGQSGSGKTFVVLDMVLRCASGVADWMGNAVEPGNVVYLAGEGHHGLRGRLAGWRAHHQVEGFNMHISRSGLDLNTPSGYQRVVDNVRRLDRPPKVIIVDTVHRFMGGDENSAQDVKTMLDACGALMQEFSCTVILVHHTGNSESAQHRARGSSAWRGALDIEISVKAGDEDTPIKISQKKAKDSEQAPDVFCTLERVEIPGWYDDDGEPVTTAVLSPAEAPAKREKTSKLEKHRKLFEAAWWAAGAEEREGFPYLSRSAFMAYLTGPYGLKEASAKKYIAPSAEGKPINELMAGDIVANFEHGWMVIDKVQATSMMVRKG